MDKIIFIVLSIIISGCAIQGKVAGDVSLDAASAVKLASATGDTSVIPCYQHIGAVGTAVATVSPSTASMSMSLGPVQIAAGGASNRLQLLTEYEVSRAVKGLGQDPACAQVWLDLANTVLKASIPGLGGILP